MKLGCQRNYYKGRAAIRHYANLREPSNSLRFKLYCPLSTGNFIIYSVSLKRFRAYTFTSQSQYEGAVSASKHKVKEVDCLKVNHKKSNHPTIVPALATHSQYPTPIIIFTSIDTWWEQKSLTIFPIIELFHFYFCSKVVYKRYCWPDYYSYRTEARASHEKDKW